MRKAYLVILGLVFYLTCCQLVSADERSDAVRKARSYIDSFEQSTTETRGANKIGSASNATFKINIRMPAERLNRL